MRLEFYPKERLRTQVRQILRKYLNLNEYRIFFFGSRVSGSGNERSDIDIGIEGSQRVPPAIWAKILEGMDGLPTLYKIDLVDFKNISPDFRQAALKNIEGIANDEA